MKIELIFDETAGCLLSLLLVCSVFYLIFFFFFLRNDVWKWYPGPVLRGYLFSMTLFSIMS